MIDIRKGVGPSASSLLLLPPRLLPDHLPFCLGSALLRLFAPMKLLFVSRAMEKFFAEIEAKVDGGGVEMFLNNKLERILLVIFRLHISVNQHSRKRTSPSFTRGVAVIGDRNGGVRWCLCPRNQLKSFFLKVEV